MPKKLTPTNRKRKIIRRIVIAVMSLLVLIVLGLVYADWQWSRTFATVTNRSRHTIDDVEIRLDTGGLYALGRLESGQTKSVRIFPRGDAGMQASFLSGAEYKKQLSPQVYIKATGGYRPELTISNNNTAQWSYNKNFLWPYPNGAASVKDTL